MKELIVLSEKEQPYKLVKAPYLPTRLLDLEGSCTSGLRLFITKNNLTIPKLDSYQKRYAALNYCWGSDSATTQLTTTRLWTNVYPPSRWRTSSRRCLIQYRCVDRWVSDTSGSMHCASSKETQMTGQRNHSRCPRFTKTATSHSVSFKAILAPVAF
ncbi:hypothetical protein BKA60DRAFT_571685 [Fusarium oxysporum]|nr:hypothetical protein BKA60DRAFT_571685 [Fusarium oxysporum]